MTFTCSELTIEILEQGGRGRGGVILFQVSNKDVATTSLTRRHYPVVNDVVLVSLLLTLNRFYTLFLCFNCYFEQLEGDLYERLEMKIERVCL